MVFGYFQKSNVKGRILAVLLSLLCVWTLAGWAVPSVQASETKLTFTKKTKEVRVGGSYTFKVSQSGAKWSVSDTSVASISSKGKFTAKKYGTVKVIAKVGKKKASCKVSVTPKAVVGIDAGHQARGNNGKEPNGPGSSVMKTKVAGGTSGVSTKKPEYQLTLEIALRLKTELEARGYRVVMTRETNDIDISNKERAEKLNAECDIALRLHADGAAASASGASIQCHTAKNPYIARLYDASNRLSASILNAYCTETGIRNRGIAYRDDLTGTNWSTIPVTLLEMGFMTNASDDAYMSSEAGQAAMVRGIANGIDAYFQ